MQRFQGNVLNMTTGKSLKLAIALPTVTLGYVWLNLAIATGEYNPLSYYQKVRQNKTDERVMLEGGKDIFATPSRENEAELA